MNSRKIIFREFTRCNINYIVDGYVIIFNYFPFLLKLLKHCFWRLHHILSDNHWFHLVNVAAIFARAELPRMCHDFIIHQHSVLLYKDHLKKKFFFTKFHKGTTYLCEALNIVLLYSTLRKGILPLWSVKYSITLFH